jgi:molecular chaperone GrpE
MNDRDGQTSSDQEPVFSSEPAQQAQSIPQAKPARQPEPATATGSFEELDRELSHTNDQLLRALAEMDNMRKRSEREVISARAYGTTAFARDIIGVVDNMHRAMQSLGDELRSQADDATRALPEGVELTQRELINVLEKNGVKRIESLGQKFDQNRHKAMKEVEDASVSPENIVQVMQEGYQIGDRVLRPALVTVAKAAATRAAASASVDENPTGENATSRN